MTVTHRPAKFSRAMRCLAVAGLVLGATALGAAAQAVALPGTARADSGYAPAASAPIHPGVVMTSTAGQCTANFVFRSGDKLYLGQAAHCTGTGDPSDTDGCKAGSLPLGTPIKIQGASQPGRLAYNSWLAMQHHGEKDRTTCAFNDFALVEIDPADTGKVNPTVPT